ncbi:hypothetical protein ACE5D9_01340 [Rickettsia sp. 2024-CO-Wats]|uniref:hypothetical protein n=1 Tax=unclassified Rickettsia TaxID=114295 RepID=UPI00370D9680
MYKYDNKNQGAIENGLTAARLANDHEKIQEYIGLLSLKEELEQYENQNPIEIHEYYQSIKKCTFTSYYRAGYS